MIGCRAGLLPCPVVDDSDAPCRYEPLLRHAPEPFPESESGWACSRCLFPLRAPVEKPQGASEARLISQMKYVQSFGQICPRCESDKLSFSDSQNEIGYFLERVDCDECNLQFERVFDLSGYNVIA